MKSSLSSVFLVATLAGLSTANPDQLKARTPKRDNWFPQPNLPNRILESQSCNGASSAVGEVIETWTVTASAPLASVASVSRAIQTTDPALVSASSSSSPASSISSWASESAITSISKFSATPVTFTIPDISTATSIPNTGTFQNGTFTNQNGTEGGMHFNSTTAASSALPAISVASSLQNLSLSVTLGLKTATSQMGLLIATGSPTPASGTNGAKATATGAGERLSSLGWTGVGIIVGSIEWVVVGGLF